jgi:hypothetical protein
MSDGVRWAWRPQDRPQKALVVRLNKLAALVVLGKYLGMFDERPQNSNVTISDEPMSAEEWKKQYVTDR